MTSARPHHPHLVCSSPRGAMRLVPHIIHLCLRHRNNAIRMHRPKYNQQPIKSPTEQQVRQGGGEAGSAEAGDVEAGDGEASDGEGRAASRSMKTQLWLPSRTCSADLLAS